MKKVISLLIFAVTLAAVSHIYAVRAESLEKIPSPDQIKNFQKIEKRGTALFGIRVNKAGTTVQLKISPVDRRPEADLQGTPSDTATSSDMNLDSTASSTSLMRSLELRASSTILTKILEKISSPDQIKNFQKIEKRGGSLYGIRVGFAKTAERLTTATSSLVISKDGINPRKPQLATSTLINFIPAAFFTGSASTTMIRSDIADCISTAIDTKDKALVDKETTFFNSLNSLISQRSTCQQAAIKSAGNQRGSLEVCVRDFRSANSKLDSQIQSDRQLIQDSYRSSLKVCSNSTSSSETAATSSIMIDDGGIN